MSEVKQKSLESQATELTQNMTKEEVEYALQLQDAELMKQLLSTVGNIVDTVDKQGQVIETLESRVSDLEKNMDTLSKSFTKAVAKIVILSKAMGGQSNV